MELDAYMNIAFSMVLCIFHLAFRPWTALDMRPVLARLAVWQLARMWC